MVYYCERCKNSFEVGNSVNFVKTAMPKCPYCGSLEVDLSKEEFAKKNRLNTSKEENLTKA